MPAPQPNSQAIEKWLKLIRADGVGPTIFIRLLNAYHDIDTILGCSARGLQQVKGIGAAGAEKIARSLNNYDPLPELETAAKQGVWLVHYQDERYPAPLRQLYSPPPVLYVRGTLSKQDNLAVAIVGSRQCTIYGTEQASRFAYGLAAASITVVSGLARGIELPHTAAHSMQAEGR